ncbi:MAG TPA: hypothetical protein VHJ78_02790 [Actinomycetota bacterium]|nr:hypothetical protein [Actinomycetota bacterium]
MTGNDRMSITRHRISIEGRGTFVLWIPFVLLAAAVTGLIATFSEITTSGWEKWTQLPRWYAGAIGFYMTWMYLPVYIAHGRTRREFVREAPGAIIVLSGILAALVAAGFAIEAVAYRAAGWPQTLTSTHLFSSPTDFALILVEYWLAFLVWIVAGTFLGAAFYRQPGFGLLLVPVALMLVTVMEAALGDDGTISALPPVIQLFDLTPQGASLFRALGTAAVCTVIGYGLTWSLARELPMRRKPA